MIITIGADPATGAKKGNGTGIAILADGLPIAVFALLPPVYRDPFDRITWLRQRLDDNLKALDIWRDSTVYVAIEKPPQGHNARQPAPALMFWIQQLESYFRWNMGVETTFYQESEWRTVCSTKGAGRPTKGHVRWWLRATHPDIEALWDTPGGPDAGEALAIAVYHWDRVRLGLVDEPVRRKKGAE